MSEEKKEIRLSKATKELGIGIDHIVDYLNGRGIQVVKNPNSKIPVDAFTLLMKEFAPDSLARQEANEITREKYKRENTILEANEPGFIKVGRNGDSDDEIQQQLPDIKRKASEKPKPVEGKPDIIKDQVVKAQGPNILDKIDLSPLERPRKKGLYIAENINLKSTKESDKNFENLNYKGDQGKFQEYIKQLKDKKHIILQGPPGTGKTFLSIMLATYLAEGRKDNYKIVQFHPSYGYEEFVEGIRLTETGGFKVQNGIFRDICKEASQRLNEKFILIIDEINRGNVSKIFGELLFLLENRSEKIILPHSKTAFSVPNNLYVIGTMNTADRSLAFVDFAIRRRFRFITLLPDYELLSALLIPKEGNENLVRIFPRNLKLFNKRINDNSSLGKDYQIGISYFVQQHFSIETLNAIWVYEISPLLEEYFYDDPQQIIDLKEILFKDLS